MRRSLLGFVALVLVIACASCGPAPAAELSGTATALDNSRPFGGDAATEGAPVSGGTVTVGVTSEPNSFDPTAATSGDSASAVYDSLMKLDENSQPQPYLAKAMTTPDDGTTWVLELRPGVLFQDGTPLDADAVVFNVQRHIDITTSPAHLIAAQIASMTAVDPYTVRFVMDHPTGAFPAAFALRFQLGNLGAIGSPAAIEKWGAEYGRHPVGAGPFKLEEWIPDSRIVLTKFDQYWQPGLPHLDGLVFRTIPDTETRYASILNGDIDIDGALYHTEILRASADHNLNVYYGQGGGGNYLALNFSKQPFDDRRMREALIRSIDPNALSVTQFKGFMDVTRTSFPAGSPYFNPEADSAWPTYDPTKAKQLIDEYVRDGGSPSFTLTSSNAPNNVALGQFLQAQWAAAGLDVELNFLDLSAWIEVAHSGDFQVGTVTNGPWDGPYPNAINLYHSGGTLNYSSYSSPVMDAALDEAVRTTDLAQQAAAYQKADLIAAQDLVVAWLARAYTGLITRKNIHGVVKLLSRETFWATMWKSP